MPFMRNLRFPQSAEDKSQDGCHGKRRHRLVLDRFVDGTFEVAGDLLDLVADLAPLFGHAVGIMLRLVGHLAEFVGGPCGNPIELIFLFEVVGRASGLAAIGGALRGHLKYSPCCGLNEGQRRRVQLVPLAH
jgi:hypothetical protein